MATLFTLLLLLLLLLLVVVVVVVVATGFVGLWTSNKVSRLIVLLFSFSFSSRNVPSRTVLNEIFGGRGRPVGAGEGRGVVGGLT